MRLGCLSHGTHLPSCLSPRFGATVDCFLITPLFSFPSPPTLNPSSILLSNFQNRCQICAPLSTLWPCHLPKRALSLVCTVAFIGSSCFRLLPKSQSCVTKMQINSRHPHASQDEVQTPYTELEAEPLDAVGQFASCSGLLATMSTG